MKAVPGTPKSVDVVRMASWDVVAIRLCPASSKSGAIAQTLFYRADTFFCRGTSRGRDFARDPHACGAKRVHLAIV
jgi:hypothetical protein